MAHNSFHFRLCPWKEKERNIACIFKIIVQSFIYMNICIYIDSVIAMLFILAFSDLLSRKHNQVVKKHPFKEQRTGLLSFLLALNFY